MSHLLFATLGTLGDVHPFLALALEARQRGHDVRLASSPRFRPMVEAAGVDFLEIGSDDYLDRQEGRDALVEPLYGFENFLRLSNLEHFDAIYAPLVRAADGARAMVSTPFVVPAHLAAAAAGIPFVLGVLSPASLRPPEGREAGQLPPDFMAWRRILNAKRAELGLPKRPAPQMERLSAAQLALGLYPQLISEGVEDLPVSLTEVGYPFPPREGSLSPELAAWMAEGPFALFTFGSFVDRDAPAMFAKTQAACQDLGLRCLYLSPFSADRLGRGDSHVRIERYAPHHLVMPLAAVVVHHGGTGTLAEACDAGAAQIVVPFALDQTYNARRLAASGLGQLLPAQHYETSALVRAIKAALSGDYCAFGSLRAERAAERAISLIEQLPRSAA